MSNLEVLVNLKPFLTFVVIQYKHCYGSVMIKFIRKKC